MLRGWESGEARLRGYKLPPLAEILLKRAITAYVSEIFILLRGLKSCCCFKLHNGNAKREIKTMAQVQ